MNTIFKKSLDKLISLSADALRGYCCRFRTDLGSAEWKIGLGLLALKRTGAFRELGYSTLSDFAERALNLSGRKVGQLLGAAEALEHLPVLSEAYRKGEIGWGKVRAIHGLATPETEEEWLRFAAAHGTEEVARKVALSPRNWKRHNALKASLEGKPISTADLVREVLARPLPAKCGPVENGPSEAGRTEGGAQGSFTSKAEPLPVSTEVVSPVLSILPCAGERSAHPVASAAGPSVSETVSVPPVTSPSLPAHSKKVRFTVEMDADDYAVFEQAETRIRARAGRRLRRSKVLLKMAEAVLSEGTARDRARHQVIIHTVEDAEGGWYETDRGVLPASPEVVQQALQSGRVLRAEDLWGAEGAEGDSGQESSGRYKSVETNLPGDLPGSDSLQGMEGDSPGSGALGANPPGDSSSNEPAQGIDSNPPGDSPRNDHVHGVEANPLGDSASNESSRRFETDAPSDSSAHRQSECPNPNPPGEPPSNDTPQDTDTNPPGDSSTPSADQNLVFQRKPVPNATIRKLYARANKRCERCQASGCRLHIHHCTPVSEGGGDNRLETLELLCSACHSLEHERDFKQKLHWSRARDSAMLQSGTTTRAHSSP